MGLPWYRVVI